MTSLTVHNGRTATVGDGAGNELEGVGRHDRELYPIQRTCGGLGVGIDGGLVGTWPCGGGA